MFGALLIFINCANSESQMTQNITITETFSGKEIKDSYRYLENLRDTTTIEWFKKQEEKTVAVIDKINGRKTLLEQVSESSNKAPSYSITKLNITPNDYYFYLKKKSSEDVAQLYYRKGFKGEEILLYNPKDFKPRTHKKYLINYIKPSWDASKIVISLTEGGKEISEMIILEVTTKKVYPEIIDHCWPSGIADTYWLPNNSAIIYSYIPDIDKNSKNYILNTVSAIHKLGTDSKKFDTLMSKKNNPSLAIKEEDFPVVEVKNQDCNFIFGGITGVNPYSDYYYAPLTSLEKKISWKPLYKKENQVAKFYIAKDSIIFLTSQNASNFKICKTSLTNPDFNNPTVLVSEDSSSVITDMTLTKKGIYYVKTKNGVAAKLYKYNGLNLNQEIALPYPAGHILLSSKGYNYDDLWITLRGWTTKDTRFKYNTNTEHFEEENIIAVKQYSALKNMVIEEIEVPSHDGVLVPLSIIYKKGTQKDKNNRVLIDAYGSYGWSKTPRVHRYLLNWIRSGGIYAVAHVRGGGEKGNSWYKAGYKITKPNTWKDLIACTEYLIDNNYTTNKKMATMGGSAGGICIGRAITERPDLYAVAIIRVGILNTMRFEFAPNGKNNVKEFGTVKDSIECKALFEMDAYHHITKGVKYPAIYLTAGMNDPRVAPWQPGKFTARIQEATVSKKPILLSVDFEGGHGLGENQIKKDKKLTNLLSFTLWQTGHPDFQVQ